MTGQSDTKREGVDVVVVGAGVAGLAAAGRPATDGPRRHAGGADAADRLQRLDAGPVLLAGEAIGGATGTVDGALGSGLRAAGRVLAGGS